MAERMLKFVGTPQAMPDKRPAAERAATSTRSMPSTPEGRRAGRPLLAVRRALLSGPLPAAQQHPRLAEADRRGPAARRPTSSPQRPTPCPRSAAASARRTGCAKAIASSSSPATARSPSARSRSTSPTPPGRRAGSSRSSPRRERGAVGRHHRRRPGGPGRGRAAAARGLPGHVYDRYDRVGGLLIYGIPNFKLEKEVVQRRDEAAARPAASTST